MKRIIVSVVVLSMMFCANAITEEIDGVVWAYEIFHEGKNTFVRIKANTTTEYAGNLRIPSSIHGYSVTAIGQGAFESCWDLMSVTIPNSVTSIDASAFRNCIGLKTITIPKSVTSIGDRAFGDCWGLTSMTLPFVGPHRGSGMSFGCIFWQSSSFNYEYTRAGKMVAVSTYDYSGTLKGYTYLPPELKTVVITDETRIGRYAFAGWSELEDVSIPESVTSIGEFAFLGCKGLGEGVVIVDDCLLTVNGMCPNSVVIPQGVRLIADSAFYGCKELRSLTIPSSLTTIANSAFFGCGSLTSVTMPSGVTSIGKKAFSRCGLDRMTIPEGVTSIDDYAFEGCRTLKSVTIPESVERIGYGAFFGCSSLVSVAMPKSLTRIGAEAFSGCPVKITIPLPSKPEIRVTDVGGGELVDSIFFEISWDDVEGAESYNLYCSNDDSYHNTPPCATRITSPYRDYRTVMPGNGPWCYYWLEAVNWSGITRSEVVFGTLPLLGVERSTIVHTSVGGSADVHVEANTSWSAWSDVNWISILDGGLGDGDGTLRYEVAPNTSMSSRTGVITVTAASGTSSPVTTTITVAQTKDPYDPALSISLSTIECTSAGGSAEVPVTANTSWSARSDVNWISILDGGLGDGDGTLRCKVAENTSMLSRTGVITVNAAWNTLQKRITVVQPSKWVQSGVAASDGLYADYVRISWPSATNSTLCNIYRSTGASRTMVTATWEGVTLPYDDTTAVPGVKYYYWVEATDSARLSISSYEKGYRAVSLSLDNLMDSFSAAGGNGHVTVSANTSWSAVSYSGWIELGTKDGSGDGVLTYVVKKNMSETPRTATITLTAGIGTDHPVTQTIKLTQGNGKTDFRIVDDVLLKYHGTGGVVNIPANVVEIDPSAFEGCNGLTAFTVEQGNAAFCAEDGLLYNKDKTVLIRCPQGRKTSIEIPLTVKRIGAFAFSGCRYLSTITIPSSVTVIEDSAFLDCVELKSVAISTFSCMVNIGTHAFEGCDALTTMYLHKNTTGAYRDMLANSEIGIDVDKVSFVEVFVDGGPYRETTQDGITWEFTVKNGCATIAPSAWGKPLYEPAISTKTAGAIKIPERLGNCPVTSLGRLAFCNCSNLTSVTIPFSVKELGGSAFKNCKNLTSMVIPPQVVSVGNSAFEGCSGLTSVSMPPGVTNLGEYAFAFCSGLSSVKPLPNIESLALGTFYQCEGLKSIEMPPCIKRIGETAFYRCRSLTTVTIPTSVVEVGLHAFSGCSRLMSVFVPWRCWWIEEGAFSGCDELQVVYVDQGEVSWVKSLYDWPSRVEFVEIESLVALDDTAVTVSGDAGSGQVGVSALFGLTWEAVATVPWIEVLTPTGSGNGTVSYQFTENLTGKVRGGGIIIGGELYIITQTYRVAMSVDVEGNGSVTGEGNYDCGVDVTLTATPDAGYVFSHWSGAVSGTNSPVTVKIDEDSGATAHFVPFVPTAMATENQTDGVTISWGALTWAELYLVYRGETNQKPELSLATIAKNTLTWKDIEAVPGKTYYYWIEAVGSKEQTTSASVEGKRAVSLTGVTIWCVRELFAGASANCTCTAAYNDGTSKSVAPSWSVDGSGLTVNASGVLTAGTVANDTIATVQASYTESGITKTASAQVTVYPTFDVNDAASGVGTLSTGGSGAWIGQKKESCGGATALRSTGLASGASAWIGCSVAGAGTLTFKWRKSGSGSGKLAFAVNGSESAVCGEASDTWATVTKEFYDSGTKNIRWTYFGGSNVDAHGLVAEIVWTPGTAIIVNFNANGGAGTMEEMTFFEGADVALTSNAFTRTGYVFAGWATSSDGEVAYLDGAAAWGMTAPVGGVVTLYAVWTPNVYTVRFDANGGEGTMADESMMYDAEKALTACAFTKKGYTFAGWATSADGAVKYTNGATVKNLTATAGGTVTLYAKWTPNNYVIDFNPGQGGTGTMSDQPMTYDEEAALYANLFARTGYMFLGWTDDPNEVEEALYYDGAIVENLTDEEDGEFGLYAIWAANEYTVRFNANGGTGTMADQAFLYDEEQALRANGFARTGYTFAGWTAAGSGGSTAYSEGAVASNLTAEAGGVVTLAAQWTANPYTVRFDANGGEGTMGDLNCTYGTGKSLTACAFTRTGYTFAGWAKSAGGAVMYADRASVTDVAASGTVTLYAKWTAISYSVKFNANGGSGSMANESMTYDTAKALTACAFTRTGYTFVGWATSANGEVVYGNGQSVKNLTATQGAVINLYAKWTANAYMVKFNANGGQGTMADEPFTYDAAAKALTTCAFTRKGYTFAGWATSAGGAVKYANGAMVKNLATSGTVTLYAKWQANSYVIDFNPGQDGEGSMPDQPMTYDEAEALYPNLFHRTGYTFLGWTDDPNEVEEALYYDGAIVENLTDEEDGEFGLYAIWAANEYTVKFDANGGKGTMADQAFLYDEEQKLTLNGYTRAGCEFLGWATSAGGEVVYADGGAVSNLTATADGIVNLYAVWDVTGLVDPSETHIDTAQGEVAPYVAAATVYDGYLYDGDNVVGSVQVKVTKGKTDRKSGVFSSKVTAMVQLADGSKKISFKGGIADETGNVTEMLDKNGNRLAVAVGVKGLGGEFRRAGDVAPYQIDGVRNAFSGKSAEDKAAAAVAASRYQGAYNIVLDGGTLSVTVDKKGKAKVAGTVEGNKVSATSQLLVGEDVAAIPVVITKKVSMAFCLWVMADGTVEARGVDGVIVGKAGTLNAGAMFALDVAAAKGLAALPGLFDEYLPNGIDVAASGKKWIVAGGAKAGKLTLVKGTTNIDPVKSKFTDNMSGLKLTYKAKDGSFKGSFKVYSLENGKIKAYTANVTGVMVGDVGYGTAMIKKPSVLMPIRVESARYCVYGRYFDTICVS